MMAMVRWCVPLLAAGGWCAAQPVVAAPVLGAVQIQCAALLDVRAGQLLGPHTLSVRDGRITALQAGAAPGSDGVVLRYERGVCAPGFIDLHTHLTSETSPTSYSDGFRNNQADTAYRAQHFASVTLDAGFTTVRDLGDSDNISIALRNAINAGLLRGPRIHTSGKSLATTGGHADPTNGRRTELSGDPGPREGVLNSVGDARKAVRQRYKDGADWIKITATGGVLSLAKNGLNPQFSQPELNAVVATARDYDLPVAAHAHGTEGMRRAIEAGVSTIEHGTYMDASLHALMKKHGTWYVPTLMAGHYVAQQSKIPGYYPEIVRPKAASIGPQLIQSFGKAYKAGVKIAFGTDAGVFPHGRNAEEFALMVEGGMPAAEALRTATVHAAEVLRASDQLGELAVGRYADVVVLDGNPLTDIRATERVLAVVKSGVAVFQRPASGDASDGT